MPWMHWSPRATDIILEHPLYVTNTTITWDTTNIIEPQHEISNNVVCATSKVSDQPAHTRSLIRAFASF